MYARQLVYAQQLTYAQQLAPVHKQHSVNVTIVGAQRARTRKFAQSELY